MRRTLSALFLSLCVLACLQNAHAADDAPERLIRDFYQWYLTADSSVTHPIETDAIYDFVDPCTVKMCRERLERGTLEADYFIDAQDTGENWARAISVSPVVTINAATCLVAVTFDKNGPTAHHLVVFLTKSGGSWRILKVQGLDS
jgi:hypothetical protein